MQIPNSVKMEGVRIIFRNFRGLEGPFNQAGAINFAVVLPEDVAEAMAADGWNVKQLKPGEEELEEGLEHGPSYLPVKVNYDKGRPPKIYTVTERGTTLITKETIETLDGVDIANVDLIIRPYPYSFGGREGIAAYVQTMYVTIEEDELEQKYSSRNAQ